MTKRNIFQQKSVRHDSLVFLQLTFCFPFIKMCLFAPFLCFLKKKWISMRNISKRWRGSGRLVFLMSCVKVILLEDMKNGLDFSDIFLHRFLKLFANAQNSVIKLNIQNKWNHPFLCQEKTFCGDFFLKELNSFFIVSSDFNPKGLIESSSSFVHVQNDDYQSSFQHNVVWAYA